MDVDPALQLSKPESFLIWAQDWRFSCGQRGLHPDSKRLCHMGTWPASLAQPSLAQYSFPSPDLRLTPSHSPIS